MITGLQSLGIDLENIASNVGAGFTRAYLNSLYPEEFEYYLFTLELIDKNGKVDEILTFPVMPTSIQEARTSLVNIKKTNSSIVSLTNISFAPTNISISGTFGRKIRILLGKEFSQANAFNFNINSQLNGEIKSGYGVTKVLERIIKKSQTIEGSLLFMYNLSLNNNYLVECSEMSFSQSMENNAFWNYSLYFKSLARAEDVYPGGKEAQKKKISEMLKFDNINKGINSLSNLLSSIKSITNEAIFSVSQKLKK